MKTKNIALITGISLACLTGTLIARNRGIKDIVKESKMERLLNKGKVIPVPYSNYMVIQYGKKIYELYKPVGSKYIREEVREFQ